MGSLIPSIVDGLKEHERLGLYWALEYYGDGEKVDVHELARSMYPSSEGCAMDYRVDAISRLALNFVGTNNINLFQPFGDFGNRYQGPLKIGPFTDGLEISVNPITRYIFHKDDDDVAMTAFEGCNSCSKSPHWLLPVIPFILVNGSDGNGSWLKSCIPKYNLQDIIDNVRLYLAKKEMNPMLPCFKGFKGKVELSPTDDTQYVISGVIAKIDHTRMAVTITELPIGLWTCEYIAWLDAQPWITAVKDLSESTGTVHLEVTLSNDVWLADVEYLMKTLKLIRTISLSDMHLIDPCGDVVRYESPQEIIRDFVDYRFAFYYRRQDANLSTFKSELRSVESYIQQSILNAAHLSRIIKHQMSILKESPETDKLSNLLGSLFEKIEVLDKVEPMIGEMENELVSIYGTASALLVSQHTGEKEHYSEDVILALENLCNSLQKISVAVSEVAKLCIKRDGLRSRLDNLQREDVLSWWFDDLDELELHLKSQSQKHEKQDSEDSIISSQRSIGWKRKAEIC